MLVYQRLDFFTIESRIYVTNQIEDVRQLDSHILGEGRLWLSPTLRAYGCDPFSDVAPGL